MQIIPGLLEYSVEEFRNKIDQIPNGFERVHIDVVGSGFVEGETIGPKDWGDLSKIKLIGCHLMLENPMLMINESVGAGVDLVIGQMEKLRDLKGFILGVQNRGVQVGLAIDLDTKIEKVELDIGRRIDSWLVLTVRAGYSGQKFQVSALEKVKKLRQIYGNNAEILVDGGVNEENVGQCVKAGADSVVVNSALWGDFEENLAKLQEVATME